MLRSLKTIFGAGLLALTAITAGAFSLGGPPNEAHQIPAMSYDLGADNVAPKNLAEEYRWNIPVLYYSFDESFLDYFGSNGVAAVDEAFATYNILPPASASSADLSEFPLEVKRVNFQAQALQLYDVKSVTMRLIAEELGLAEPDRWTWCLRTRVPITPPGCPAMSYTVIKRNFDPVTWEPSTYVNGTLYTYQIFEACDPGDAVEVLLDPLALQFTAVAGFVPGVGEFHAGLTRDDFAGLKYLLTTNSLPNIEAVPAGVQQISTNVATELLTTLNLAELKSRAFTNDAATLLTNYPGLIITGTTNIFTNYFTTNITAYLTNYPQSPVGSAPTTVFLTNLTPFVGIVYLHSFGNIVTNHYYSNSLYTIQTTMTTNYPQAPFGSPPVTNTTTVTVLTNIPAGDFYIVPQNSNACGITFVNPLFTNVTVITNFSINATNNPAVTNGLFIQSQISYFTNYTFVVKLVQCPQGGAALRRGIEKITFVRRDFDSLLGQIYEPVTNVFSHKEIVNNAEVVRAYRRIVNVPDILIQAQDFGTAPLLVERTAPNFTKAPSGYENLAGPGIIQPSVGIAYNKVGPIYANTGPAFVTEADSVFIFQWGSFDGSTNSPVLYPSSQSLQNLNNQLLLRVTNPALTTGQVGVGYNYTLLGSGGLAPYTWAVIPNQFGLPSGLPPGLSLSAGGTITGTPTQSGTFNFVVRMTDAPARFIERPLTIVVNP